MKLPLIARLLVASTFQTFVEFSHIIVLGVAGFSISALSKDGSWETIGTCLTLVVLGATLLQVVRSMSQLKQFKPHSIRLQLLERLPREQAELCIKLSYLTVLLVGCVVVLLLIGSREAWIVLIAGNALAWLMGTGFVKFTAKPLRNQTIATRDKLRPWRELSLDLIPLASFIIGLALFPELVNIKAILVFLLLRKTSTTLFSMAHTTGMQKHLAMIDDA